MPYRQLSLQAYLTPLSPSLPNLRNASKSSKAPEVMQITQSFIKQPQAYPTPSSPTPCHPQDLSSLLVRLRQTIPPPVD